MLQEVVDQKCVLHPHRASKITQLELFAVRDRVAKALDEKGFVKTGPDLSREELNAAGWSLARSPFLLETSRPGVFAGSDVRAGNIKRVASAVGEGSIAVAFVHQVLQRT